MKIELEVSEENESTAEPWWVILDPRQMFRLNVHELASMITGPFFSRESAESFLKRTRYNFGKHAKVYCHSGYCSDEYKTACRKALAKED